MKAATLRCSFPTVVLALLSARLAMSHAVTRNSEVVQRIDQAEASASLVVRDAPNPPINVRAQCEQRTAIVSWEPNGYNREAISEYIIQYSTSFEPGKWADLKTGIPPSNLTQLLDLSPWANYTFRVIGRNRIGLSNASAPTEAICTTPPDVPHKNPDNIQGKVNQRHSFTISWTPMPQIDHNGPGLYYEVRYIRDAKDPLAQRVENTLLMKDWRMGSVTLVDQPPNVPYDIWVIAMNAFGPSKMVNAPPVRVVSASSPSAAVSADSTTALPADTTEPPPNKTEAI